MNWNKVIVRGRMQIGNKIFIYVPNFELYLSKRGQRIQAAKVYAPMCGVIILALKEDGSKRIDYVRYISNTRYD